MLVLVGLVVAVYPLDKTAVFTVVAYVPAVCTDDLGHSDCGRAKLTVVTASGDLQTLYYDGKMHPEGPAASKAVDVYKPGARIEITTSGADHSNVIRVRPAY
jgi:hypothetical protein